MNAWVDARFQEKWPSSLYEQEQQAAQHASAPTWQKLRDYFRETISPNIKKALELIGNPNSVPCVVHNHKSKGLS